MLMTLFSVPLLVKRRKLRNIKCLRVVKPIFAHRSGPLLVPHAASSAHLPRAPNCAFVVGAAMAAVDPVRPWLFGAHQLARHHEADMVLPALLFLDTAWSCSRCSWGGTLCS